VELTKEKAKENLSKLIEKFRGELESGRAQDYNEESTKISFIQPLLEDVLGWDVRNHDEVSPEEKVSKGRVDYGLKVEGVTKMYVEAKPIRADLNKHIDQAIRYGYNKKGVPFVLLTDFEGIKLFDVTVKPDARNFLKGLNIDLSWEEYLEQFDKIWLLSKDSVIKGELDKLLLVKPKNRLPVDKAILDDLKRWRVSLAKNIFKNNHDLFNSGDREKDAHFLKEITQRLLDRIIFMRSCEDRDLTYRPKLKEIFEERTESVGTNTIIFLREEFKHYNIIFDSDLFSPKEWESDLAVDFTVMREIILETYNPYQFDVIPLEVLGNIYEQYLGYTVRLTDHQVKYELKPEVRKAGGVYYTPEYIVDYIVKNTVGKLIQELSDRKIKKLRILDPACGSGSFLIRAYEEMLKYYRSQKKGKKKSKNKMSKLEFDYEETETHLTIEDKGEILRRHIFGVDLDEQAVEVTKLSLMLKMLEDEYGLIHGRSILPILDRNIRCGNSLISGDVLELKNYFGDNWYIVKSFNWEDVFQKIMIDEGGFDVVIGNPPYGAEISSMEKAYFESSFNLHNTDTACLFMGLSTRILKDGGINGFIIPKPFTYSSNWKYIREKLYDGLIEIVDCERVWKEVRLEQIIYTFRKNKKSRNYRSCFRNEKNIEYLGEINKKTFGEFGLFLNDISPVELCLGQKIRNVGTFLNNFIVNQRGAMYQKNVTEYPSDFKVLGGKQIGRYFIYQEEKGFVSKDIIQDEKAYIKGKAILVQNIVAHIKQPIGHIKIIATLPKNIDTSTYIILDTVNQLQNKSNLSSEFIISVLNSKLLSWYVYRFIFGKAIRTMHFDNYVTDRIPFPTIDLNKHSENQFNDTAIALVNEMLDLNKKIHTAQGNEKEQIQRQIKKTDKEIDEIVYKLYGITEEEKKIIEEST